MQESETIVLADAMDVFQFHILSIRLSSLSIVQTEKQPTEKMSK